MFFYNFCIAFFRGVIFFSVNIYNANFVFMKAIQYKMSMVLAGFLNSMNFLPDLPLNSVSKFTGSLPANFEISYEDGFADDAERINGDWSMIKSDIRKSFDNLTNDAENS